MKLINRTILFMFSLFTIVVSAQNKHEEAEYYHNVAINYLIDNDLEDALSNINTSITYNERKSTSYYIRGIIYEKKELYYSAIENFKKAIEIDPSETDYYVKTAISYKYLNDLRNACIFLNEACKLGDKEACDIVSINCLDYLTLNEDNEYTIKNDKYFSVRDMPVQPHTNPSQNDYYVQQYNQNQQQPTYTKGGFFDNYLKTDRFLNEYATDKTIRDTHIKQDDGTWKPKYKSYDPHRNNDAIPGNKINYSNSDDALIIIFGLGFIGILLIIFLVSRSQKNKKTALNQSNPPLNTNARHNQNNNQLLNKQLIFTKYKFTESLLYKHLYTTIDISSDCIKINCAPIFAYNGNYYIQNIQYNNTFNITRFIVRYGDPEIGEDFTIDIEKRGKKVSLYRKDLVGIIFKT